MTIDARSTAPPDQVPIFLPADHMGPEAVDLEGEEDAGRRPRRGGQETETTGETTVQEPVEAAVRTRAMLPAASQEDASGVALPALAALLALLAVARPPLDIGQPSNAATVAPT